MDAIDLLTQDHRALDDLFDRIGRTDLPDEKEALIEEIAQALAVHSILEEQHFYPAVRGEGSAKLVRSLVDDHDLIKRKLSRLLELDGDDEAFDDEVLLLQREVETHVAEEERELFPLVRRTFSVDDLEELADRMRATRESNSELEPREYVAAELSPAP